MKPDELNSQVKEITGELVSQRESEEQRKKANEEKKRVEIEKLVERAMIGYDIMHELVSLPEVIEFSKLREIYRVETMVEGLKRYGFSGSTDEIRIVSGKMRYYGPGGYSEINRNRVGEQTWHLCEDDPKRGFKAYWLAEFFDGVRDMGRDLATDKLFELIKKEAERQKQRTGRK